MLLGGQDPQQQERIAPLAQRLEAYSTGNPLLLEVAIQALLDANGVATPAALPSTIDLEIPLSAASQAAPIRNLIGARIDRLPTNARMLLEQLAMLDRSVSLDLIEHLGGEEALAHAQILLDRHFLIDIGDDRLDFRHRTVRASIVALLGSPRRRLLHRQIAHALAALHGDRIERAAEIARHLEQAGRGFERELVRYSTLAGDYARQLFGYSEALYWYEHALAVAAQLGSQAPADLVEQAQAGRAALQQSNQPR
jgi:predicted ATPase